LIGCKINLAHARIQRRDNARLTRTFRQRQQGADARYWQFSTER